MGRAAKAQVDYTSNGLKKREQKANQKQQPSQHGTQKSDEEEVEDGEDLIDQIDKDLEEETMQKRQKLADK